MIFLYAKCYVIHIVLDRIKSNQIKSYCCLAEHILSLALVSNLRRASYLVITISLAYHLTLATLLFSGTHNVTGFSEQSQASFLSFCYCFLGLSPNSGHIAV